MTSRRRLPMFPLGTVLLPGGYLPLHVFEDRYRLMTRECLATDRLFGVVLIERGREVGGGDERADFGTTADIEAASELPDGRFALACRGVARLEVTEWLPDDPYPQAMVEVSDTESPVEPRDLELSEASVRRAWALLSELGAASPAVLSDRSDAEGSDPNWLWCNLAPLSDLDRYCLLRAATTAERQRLLVELTDAVASDARNLLAERQD